MTKHELRAFRGKANEIKQLEEQILILADVSPKASRFDKILVDSGRTGSPVEEIVERLIVLRERYQAALDAYTAEKLLIERAFEILTPNERAALRYYYFENLTWEQTAEKMDKSVRYILSLHKWALIKLKEI